MSDWLRAELAASGGRPLEGLALLNQQPSLSRRNCLFLGMLEMARGQEIEIEQREHFGFLSIQRPASLKTDYRKM